MIKRRCTLQKKKKNFIKHLILCSYFSNKIRWKTANETKQRPKSTTSNKTTKMLNSDTEGISWKDVIKVKMEILLLWDNVLKLLWFLLTCNLILQKKNRMTLWQLFFKMIFIQHFDFLNADRQTHTYLNAWIKLA